MKAGILVFITLMNGGHWFGGQLGSIELQWTAKAQMPPSVVEWQLMYGTVELRAGRNRFVGDPPAMTLKLEPPVVRERSTLQWKYRVRDLQRNETITEGAVPIQLYPRGDLS